ncbi:MAG: cupin domain-containing protein [Anaerolineaceae bacterium]|nr:cupin domain-containing protein [Anaerolineaceae bacterium]MDD4043513.1 cupin domain-containing protein [Anaerolineaceae bacterium]MDD4577315.1 cupin domain-containing protein [Anaerolineaceae bacterium]
MSVKHSNDIPSEPLPVGEGASKAVLISDQEAPNFAMRKFTIRPGGSMPLHINLVEHEQYVLNGKALLRIEDVIHEVQPGDVVFIPAKVPHSYESVGDEAFEFLCLIPNKFDETIIVEKIG